MIDQVLAKVRTELDRSIEKHGDWQSYEPEDMIEKIGRELQEADDAAMNGDMYGPHGMYNELAQVAATAIKGMMVLRGRRAPK